jgi:hypothetical protein
MSVMNLRRLIAAPEPRAQIVATFMFGQEVSDVRFGSEADMCTAKKIYVRFVPIADIALLTRSPRQRVVAVELARRGRAP